MSSVPRARKNSTSRCTSSSGALAPEVIPTTGLPVSHCSRTWSLVVDQVSLGAMLARDLDQPVGVRGVPRADHQHQVALTGELFDSRLTVGGRVADVISPGRRARLEAALEHAAPPIHLTPLTRDENIAQQWFERFEGAGLDGLIAKRLDLTYQPDKRVMTKIKHVRTADCVVAGYRVHKTAKDAIGSLLLGLYRDETAPPSQWMDAMKHGLVPVGVIGAFPMARRRELLTELQPLIIPITEHPWDWSAHFEGGPEGGSRWNPGKDLSFVPLKPERVVEVRYDYLEGGRFRHPPQFVRWRPDRDPESCGYAQLDRPTPFALADVIGA